MHRRQCIVTAFIFLGADADIQADVSCFPASGQGQERAQSYRAPFFKRLCTGLCMNGVFIMQQLCDTIMKSTKVLTLTF